MNPRRAWLGATGLLMAATAAVLFVPGWRLGRERSAARSEGLALTIDELRPNPPVPDALNAAPLLQKARVAWLRTRAYRQPLPIIAESGRVIDGKGSAKDRADVLAWARKTAPNLAEWRAASRRPRVDFGERAQYRWSEYGLDLIEDRYAAMVLVAASAVGVDSRENLLAAARLSALMRSEGEIHAASRGALLGVECLKVARRTGMVKETLAALGPPTDLRAALRPGLPQLLKLVGEARRDDFHRKGPLVWLDRFLHPAGAREIAAISGWRALSRSLPKETDDYEGAARVCDARLPGLMDLTRIDGSPPGHPMPRFTVKLGGTGLDVGRSLRAVGQFEAMRKANAKP